MMKSVITRHGSALHSKIGGVQRPRYSRKQSKHRNDLLVLRTLAQGSIAPQDAELNTWLIVGLGNPGDDYDLTRHNVGFDAVDYLASTEKITLNKLEKNALTARNTLFGQRLILAKPMTFMNKSGSAVNALRKFYKLPTERVLVIYDDLDLEVAQLRLRSSGGHGGHNGMKSIIESFGGDKSFPRLRIGIGHPGHPSRVADYVLKRFNRKERQEIDASIVRSTDIIKTIVEQGITKALSTCN